MSALDRRYAIYFVPDADTPLYGFGAAVLGYDCRTGAAMPFIREVDPAGWPRIVQEPRRYGFHATLKAPFRLADGSEEAALLQAAQAFASTRAPVQSGSLAVREIGRFIALAPVEPCAAIDELAAACVQEFDVFRAPLSAEDRERRLAAVLTDRQVRHLDRWGYPYVFEDFRFHMTLTGPLGPPERAEALRLLRTEFEQLTDPSLTIDRIVVACQPGKAQSFRVVAEAPLTGN